jgi:hypothetical protein
MYSALANSLKKQRLLETVPLIGDVGGSWSASELANSGKASTQR